MGPSDEKIRELTENFDLRVLLGRIEDIEGQKKRGNSHIQVSVGDILFFVFWLLFLRTLTFFLLFLDVLHEGLVDIFNFECGCNRFFLELAGL